MADFAVNYDAMDMGSAPQSALAVGPTTYRAFTNDGDFAGEVNMAYKGPVRVIDPATGKPVFESADPDAAMKAFALVNGVSNSDGGKASWAVQIDNGNGWETAAMDNIDTKKQSLLGKLADIALPILGAIFLPGIGGIFAAMSAMGGAAAGAALGSVVSSAAQGRSIEDTAKRALISAVTAGAASGVSGAIASNMAAQAVAKGTLTAAEAASLGASASQLVSAGLTPAAAQAAVQAGKALTEVVVLGGTGAATGAANLAVNVAGNLAGVEAANVLQGGTGADTVKTPEDFVSDELTVVGKGGSGTAFDPVLQAGSSAAANTIEELIITGKATPDQVQTVHKSLALGLTPEEIAAGLGIPLATVGIIQSGGGAIEAANLADPAIAGGEIVGAGAAAPAFASLKEGMAWIAANPLLAARLGLTAASLLATFGGSGSGVDGNGLATGGGTPPALQQSALFKKALPTPSGIFANLTPRDVSKSVTDWNNYGAGPEQSFFNSVPVRASGVTPDPKLVVTPSNPTTPTSPTTGTGTTGTTTNPQTPTNLAVQNMTKYGQTPGVLDLRNQPTSVDNPYAGYATTRTPPQGAVELPATSNARFVVQEPMTAAEAEKQARLSVAMGGVPTVKSDLTVKSTGTPPERTTPASASATAPVATTPTRGYSQADMDRFASSPDTVAAMRRVNATLATTDKMAADMKPLGEGLMSQWQLDQEGLKTPPPAAPKGVDPGSYYFMTQKMQGMTPAEIDAYNARVEAAPELLGTKKMAQINSPEWFMENFGLNQSQANIAAADVVAKKSPNLAVNVPATRTTGTPAQPALPAVQTARPTDEQLADLDIIQRPGNGKLADSNKAMWDAISDPAPRANPNPSNLSVQDAMREANAINAKQVDKTVDFNRQPTPTAVEAVKLPAPSLAVDVQPQQNYALNVPEDIMKQLESYNFQFNHGGSTSKAFAVNGAGDGREDKIDAKLSDGEYVIDAETVALLGNGSSKAGAQQLDKFRVNIRKHKGQKLASGKFSANAKSPEAYMAGGRS